MVSFGGDVPGAYLPVAVSQLHFAPPPKSTSLWAPHFGGTIRIFKEPATQFLVASQRPAVEMNNMRIAHMRQAHNMRVWLKKSGNLCMRMKQKEKNI